MPIGALEAALMAVGAVPAAARAAALTAVGAVRAAAHMAVREVEFTEPRSEVSLAVCTRASKRFFTDPAVVPAVVRMAVTDPQVAASVPAT